MHTYLHTHIDMLCWCTFEFLFKKCLYLFIFVSMVLLDILFTLLFTFMFRFVSFIHVYILLLLSMHECVYVCVCVFSYMCVTEKSRLLACEPTPWDIEGRVHCPIGARRNAQKHGTFGSWMSRPRPIESKDVMHDSDEGCPHH